MRQSVASLNRRVQRLVERRTVQVNGKQGTDTVVNAINLYVSFVTEALTDNAEGEDIVQPL